MWKVSHANIFLLALFQFDQTKESYIVVKYINKKTVEQISMYYYGEGVNIMIYCYICKKKVNVVTCDYKSQCSHM